jgi:tetratricopeptide (TPR) repeat protein
MKAKSKLTIWCDYLLEFSWLLTLIISPLFFNIHSDRVFEPDKITLIRSLAVFMVAVWLIKFVDSGQWRDWSWLKWGTPNSMWRVPFVLPVVALAIVYLLATFFSVTPTVSWAGSYQRLQGTYTTLSYLVIFAVMATTMRTAVQWRRVITIAIIVSIPVAFYGMLQRAGLDPLPWGGNVETRIAGHMGNAIFIAAYLIMIVPLTLARIISSFKNILSDEQLNPADIIRSSIYIVAFFIQLAAIYFSGSRGPLLGLLLGIFVLVTILLVSLRNTAVDSTSPSGYTAKEIGYASFSILLSLGGFLLAILLRPTIGDFQSFLLFLAVLALVGLSLFVLMALQIGWKWLWLSWILTAVFVGGWILAFNAFSTPNMAGNPATDSFIAWRSLPGVGRFGQLLEAERGNGLVRVLIWQGTVDLITPHDAVSRPDGSADPFNFLRPFIGYGPESMYVAYNSFYPPELATVEARNASPDRAHNETFDALVITGLLGFAIWQWLYLSIFYYAFKWLGVVGNNRDRNLLIGLWVGMGTAVALFFTLWRGPEYIGIAFPFGSLLGLVLYLVYYAIVARPTAETANLDPFRPDRLMLMALIGAIIAYYAEIHFGIAIVVTRVHFFAFTAVVLAIGYIIPHLATAPETETETAAATSASKTAKQRRTRASNSPASNAGEWLPGAVMWAFLLGIMLTVLAYNYTIYTPPPDKVIQSLEDLPTAMEIFSQSFFINPVQEFADSPFIFLLFILSWLLGVLLALSEMMKGGELTLTTTNNTLDPARQMQAAILLGLLGLLSTVAFLYAYFGVRFGDASVGWTTTERVGFLTLAPLGAILCLQAAVPLWRNSAGAHLLGTAVSLAGLALVLPLFLAGGWLAGLFLLITGGILLFLLWQEDSKQLVWPTAVVAAGSLFIGLSFAFYHASQLRSSMIMPNNLPADFTETMRRIAEAEQFASILGSVYTYLFFLLLLFALLAALPHLLREKQNGTIAGFVALALLLPLAFIAINQTNLRVIQADMIYKRGKPFDAQAARQTDPEQALRFWDNAIAVYEAALAYVPNEDFYYLWLGRAYLEKSALLQDPTARDQILETAAASLREAQRINPLNTDHTANLARLNTRWASIVPETERAQRLADAEAYYEAAIRLSPQNAVIRNEYARMVYSFTQDCPRALDLYDQSTTADPYYARTRFEKVEIMTLCAPDIPEAERAAFYAEMIATLQEAEQLAIERGGRERESLQAQIPRSWAQLAQFFQTEEAWAEALIALERLTEFPSEQVPLWNVLYQTAVTQQALGNLPAARAAAAEALTLAPDELKGQIEAFIATLE